MSAEQIEELRKDWLAKSKTASVATEALTRNRNERYNTATIPERVNFLIAEEAPLCARVLETEAAQEAAWDAYAEAAGFRLVNRTKELFDEQ